MNKGIVFEYPAEYCDYCFGRAYFSNLIIFKISILIRIGKNI